MSMNGVETTSLPSGRAYKARPAKRALTDAQVREIRKMYGPVTGKPGRRKKGAWSMQALAEEFNVCRDTISSALLGKRAYAGIVIDSVKL